MARTRYENMDGVRNVKTVRDFAAWRKERRQKTKDYSFVVPQSEHVRLDELRENSGRLSATWIGHSTFLLQLGGLNIVTDPVWAMSMGFERRLAPPGIPIREVPPVDVVILSHSHYDHLHMASVKLLPGEPQLLVPAGLARMMRRRGLHRVDELDWWDERDIRGVSFTFVPAQHWTRRTMTDMNTSHWGGWMLRHGGQSIYFAGDSGYFRGFKLIGERLGPPDVALMPIGAYEPEWFMTTQHVTPEQAVQAFEDVGGKMFVPMHYGSFRLADDTPAEALERLRAEWARRGLAPERLRILAHGETLFGSGVGDRLETRTSSMEHG